MSREPDLAERAGADHAAQLVTGYVWRVVFIRHGVPASP